MIIKALSTTKYRNNTNTQPKMWFLGMLWNAMKYCAALEKNHWARVIIQWA